MDTLETFQDMEEILAKPVEGAQPKSDVEAVAEVLTKSSTFLNNVGLEATLAKKWFTKSDPTTAAHVTKFEERLERERVQNEAMREELAVIKRESLEAEAARSARDKEIQEMLKKNEESQERFAQMIALLGAKPL